MPYISESDLAELHCRLEEADKNNERAKVLVGLLSVRQVIEAGYTAIDAAGLDPWCMNEGKADGHEKISTWWLNARPITKREEREENPEGKSQDAQQDTHSDMPDIKQIKNWLNWIEQDGYRTDWERSIARDQIEMIDLSPKTAVPGNKEPENDSLTF